MSFAIPNNLHIVAILAIGFSFASLFGYLAQRWKLSPLVGYLFAGYLIGPYSPGFVANLQTAEQLAEIGVILMLFGVGLHFKWQDLYEVKGIALPGALCQMICSTLLGFAGLYYLGWSKEASLIMGLAISIASTVVMVRMLSDYRLLSTTQGHIAVGWLIVEDILTVIALLLIPLLTLFQNKEAPSVLQLSQSVLEILFKFSLMAASVLTLGQRLVSATLFAVARLKFEELFTITLLALIFMIAVGSIFLFGTSIALGAFAAGMVVGQTVAKHRVLANALPLKDAFTVIFFLSVGMLFKPSAIWENGHSFLFALSLVLLVKPLLALAITLMLNCRFYTGLLIAISLSQIGEFSFILAEEGLKLNILPDEGFDIIVACAILSIALNPLLFSWTTRQEATSPSSLFDQGKGGRDRNKKQLGKPSKN